MSEQMLQDPREEIEVLRKKLNSLRSSLKTKIVLTQTDNYGLRKGTLRDGRNYSVRDNRDSFFYPEVWEQFIAEMNPRQKLTFNFLINTGARINEVKNVKVADVDLDNKRLILRVTKVKAAKKEKAPRPRQISISSQFTKELRAHIKLHNLQDNDYIGILSRPATHIQMRKALKKIGVKDYYMFSIHNIRKTHGNWLKALGVDGLEICTRLGHDYNTFIKSYGSADVFRNNPNTMRRIKDILGDLYTR